ncbi:MAG TPA: ribonuclease III [Vitreimonas sp.]|uniref:ribonuclease III n=1 Tax=Vitreimonas sp. TaxID=3069702 RepID=UPI002D6D5980|nr:ribonuclease III [Vitreimonas sp.]HYD88519.1 ribonuclease III [Vitreimonas sp.]
MSGPRKREVRLTELEARIGYAFEDRELLREAMTHASVLDGARKARTYDRLEFLGDRVLGLIVAERLLEQHKGASEGELAPRYNALVNRHACARAARAADLGDAVILSSSEESSGGRGKEAILADICESLIAALYLDSGMDAARTFVNRFWGDAFETGEAAPRDAKTALQEWAAARKRGLSYVMIEQTGPEHAPHFVVEARIDGFQPARGEAGSKRDAQRAAAAAFLKAQGVDG